jgi:hypothetical protein
MEFSMQDWGSRSVRKVMKTLPIINDSGDISPQALDEYAKLFKHPLPQIHVEALAALFGWSFQASPSIRALSFFFGGLVVVSFLWILQNF